MGSPREYRWEELSLAEEFVEPTDNTTQPEDEAAPSLNESFGIRTWLQDTLETLLLALIMFLVINTLTGRYQVHGQSMEPTLHDGQYLLASKATYWLHQPERGDVVVLDPPGEESSVPYIKRVVGLPEDHIEIYDGRVWVNGVALNEPYISAPPNYQGNWVVAADEYFVLGDNRNNSSDSHAWGLLPRDNIIGKAILCYWPPEKVGVIPHYTYAELEATHE